MFSASKCFYDRTRGLWDTYCLMYEERWATGHC